MEYLSNTSLNLSHILTELFDIDDEKNPADYLGVKILFIFINIVSFSVAFFGNYINILNFN